MASIELGSVIAERQLHYRDTDTGHRVIRILLGAPQQSVGSDDWYCPFQIVGVGSEKVRAVYGIDAFQALQLVMLIIGASLPARNEQVRLWWLEESEVDLGFPVQTQ
jgi:hypothetical protein